jgi:hypothetical protein
MSCISQDNYSYVSEASELSFLWRNSFIFKTGYEWVIFINNLDVDTEHLWNTKMPENI